MEREKEEITIEEFKTSVRNNTGTGKGRMNEDYIIPVAYGLTVLLAVLAGIFLLDMPLVLVCVILVLESLIGICLHDMPIWVHGLEIIISIVAGIIFEQTIFMIIGAGIYLASILALHFMNHRKG